MTESQSNIERLNQLDDAEAVQELLKCCGSQNWAKRMAESRPFQTVAELNSRAADLWWSLDSADWLEAFRSHPKIGEKKAANSLSAQAESWAGQEQSSVATASEQILSDLASLNTEYEDKFGFIYIVCATGKSPEELLALLKSRLVNQPNDELRIAANEQSKITEIRLKKLLH